MIRVAQVRPAFGAIVRHFRPPCEFARIGDQPVGLDQPDRPIGGGCRRAPVCGDRTERSDRARRDDPCPHVCDGRLSDRRGGHDLSRESYSMRTRSSVRDASFTPPRSSARLVLAMTPSVVNINAAISWVIVQRRLRRRDRCRRDDRPRDLWTDGHRRWNQDRQSGHDCPQLSHRAPQSDLFPGGNRRQQHDGRLRGHGGTGGSPRPRPNRSSSACLARKQGFCEMCPTTPRSSGFRRLPNENRWRVRRPSRDCPKCVVSFAICSGRSNNLSQQLQ